MLGHSQRWALACGTYHPESSGPRLDVVFNGRASACQSMAPSGCMGVTNATILPVIIKSLRDGQHGWGQNSMVKQLSTSECVAQPATVAFFGIALRHTQIVLVATALMLWPVLAQAQGSNFEVSIEPLTAIDQQFMDEQRGRVEQLANRLGRGLTGNTDRDLDTLQRILDERMVPPTDTRPYRPWVLYLAISWAIP